MKNTILIISAIVLLWMISCKKDNNNNPASNNFNTNKCLALNISDYPTFSNYNYDEKNRIKQILNINLSENIDELIKFEYSSNTCYVNWYNLHHSFGDISLDRIDTLILNEDGACIQYKNRHIYYNSKTKLLDSLVIFNRSTQKPEYVNYYTYDNKKQLIKIEINYFLFGEAKTLTSIVKIEYDDNIQNTSIPLIAGDPLFSGFGNNNENILYYISKHSLVLSDYFLGKNYPFSGVPIKQSIQSYNLGNPFGVAKTTNFNYRRNSSNQIDSIWQTGNNVLEDYKIEFICK